MRTSDVLADGFGRVQGVVRRVLDGITADELAGRVDAQANTVAWLVWHLTRIQDDHVADVARVDQVWTSGGWYDKFALPFGPSETGFAQDSDDVAELDGASAELLRGYHDAVHAQTLAFVRTVGDDDLDRVVDTSWDPPVTLGVRLVSVVSDDLQHAGQAAYVRGVLGRGRGST
jgi:uncharacterized damage-inducible protein DinB